MNFHIQLCIFLIFVFFGLIFIMGLAIKPAIDRRENLFKEYHKECNGILIQYQDIGYICRFR